MTRTQLEAIAKPDEVVSDFTYVDNGTDQNGFVTYKTTFVSNPLNYQVIYIDIDSKLAILKDLDYVAPIV